MAVSVSYPKSLQEGEDVVCCGRCWLFSYTGGMHTLLLCRLAPFWVDGAATGVVWLRTVASIALFVPLACNTHAASALMKAFSGHVLLLNSVRFVVVFM